MSKQVVVMDSVHEALNELVKVRRAKQPHLSINKQSVVNELVIKAHKREVKQ